MVPTWSHKFVHTDKHTPYRLYELYVEDPDTKCENYHVNIIGHICDLRVSS